MKTKFFKFTVIMLLLAAGCFSSCSEKVNEKPNIDKSVSIIGKWKLVKVQVVFYNRDLYDYSHYNIIYEFKSNNVLTVSGETDDIDTYRGHNIGEHVYSITDDDKVIPGSSPVLKIDEIYSLFSISSKSLEISYAPLDGPIYFLIKIE